jgi:hypothetical protein
VNQDRHLLYLLDLAGLRAYSFSGIILSQTCSHLIHTRLRFVPAAGLRLEISSNCDKEKSELYFSFSVKKILTEKQNQRVPKQQKFLFVSEVLSTLRSPAFSLLHHTGNVFLRL